MTLGKLVSTVRMTTLVSNSYDFLDMVSVVQNAVDGCQTEPNRATSERLLQPGWNIETHTCAQILQNQVKQNQQSGEMKAQQEWLEHTEALGGRSASDRLSSTIGVH